MNLAAEPKGSIALWRAVIAQAIQDATQYAASAPSKVYSGQARAWLLSNSLHFNEVCALADVEPSQVRVFAAKAIAEADQRAPELEAKHVAHSERVLRGRANRKQQQHRGVVANFAETPQHRTSPVAQDRA